MICPSCRGSGQTKDGKNCPQCRGRGVIAKREKNKKPKRHPLNYRDRRDGTA